ncbi:MAG: UMP kinase [Candidatus Nomurabacteria bacterium]|nr:UMP kinase [Candidatus Nomurabacteria bacterium]
MQNKEPIIISLGGSMVVPDLPNPSFINKFRDLILGWIENNNKRFFIIVGGGKTCRRYQDALSHTIEATTEDLDWIGIYSTHLNAQLLRLSFSKKAYHDIVTDPAVISSISDNVIVGAGWEPGCSTDMDAVLTAEKLNAKKIINISNIDYIYDTDPKIHPNAKKFENLTWDEYRSLITFEWKAGLNSPFDPIASKRAQELGIEVYFISGNDLESLENCINNLPFVGTTIK